MTIDCPNGWKSVAKLGKSISWENSTVTIFAGVCDSADRCGIHKCRYFDLSREATRRHQRAARDAQTLAGWAVRDADPELDSRSDYDAHRQQIGRLVELDETATLQ